MSYNPFSAVPAQPVDPSPNAQNGWAVARSGAFDEWFARYIAALTDQGFAIEITDDHRGITTNQYVLPPYAVIRMTKGGVSVDRAVSIGIATQADPESQADADMRNIWGYQYAIQTATPPVYTTTGGSSSPGPSTTVPPSSDPISQGPPNNPVSGTSSGTSGSGSGSDRDHPASGSGSAGSGTPSGTTQGSGSTGNAPGSSTWGSAGGDTNSGGTAMLSASNPFALMAAGSGTDWVVLASKRFKVAEWNYYYQELRPDQSGPGAYELGYTDVDSISLLDWLLKAQSWYQSRYGSFDAINVSLTIQKLTPLQSTPSGGAGGSGSGGGNAAYYTNGVVVPTLLGGLLALLVAFFKTQGGS